MTKKVQNKSLDWSSPAKRILWLVQQQFEGNRSAFAKVVGCSHALVFKVVAGQPPGRRFLEAVSKRLKISLAWLVSGEGQPGLGSAQGSKIPVAIQALPGSPQEYPDLLMGAGADLPTFSPHQYWLRLTSDQPIVRERGSGFRIGDQLLMDSDASRFPPKDRLYECLCICKIGSSKIKLGAVTHYLASVEDGPERFEVDTFDLGPTPESTVTETVYRQYPDGSIRHFQRRHRLATRSDGEVAPVPLSSRELEPMLPTIRFRDIIGVWTGLMRRS